MQALAFWKRIPKVAKVVKVYQVVKWERVRGRHGRGAGSD